MIKREQTKAIARAIRSTQAEASNLGDYSRKWYNQALWTTANRLATVFEMESGHFKRDVFLRECGLDGSSPSAPQSSKAAKSPSNSNSKGKR